MPQPPPLIEIRLYHLAQRGYLVVPLEQFVAGSWRTVADGGYESAQFTLATPPRIGGIAGTVKAGRRIEAWGRDKAGTGQVRLWSGRILSAIPDLSPPYTIKVQAVGAWIQASRALVPTPLVFPARVDLSQAFSAATSSALAASSETFEIGAPSTGLTTDSLEDAYEAPLKTATEALAGVGAGSVAYGSDVIGDQPGETLLTEGAFGRERLFFRPFGSAAAPSHTLIVPDPAHRITRREREEDLSRLVNVLRIRGGALNNPNLFYVPTGDNTRLDRITRAGAAGTNFLLDPGFENNTNWTYAGGASRKANTDVYGPSDGNGKWFVLFDNLAEKITQRPAVPGGVIVGRTYAFNARLRQATNKADGSASTDGVTLKLRFFTAGGIQIGADVTAFFQPAGAGVWRDAQVAAAAPATATQIEVEIELTQRTPGAAASTLGVVADNTGLFDASQVTQKGWFLTKKPGSSAVITLQNWQAIGAGGQFGPYALEVQGTSADDFDNDWWLSPGTSPNEEACAIGGGQSLRVSYWLKRLPSGAANPLLKIDFDWRDANGAFISATRVDIAAGLLTNAWVAYHAVVVAPANATGVIVRLRCRGNGGFMLDAAQLRDSSEIAGEFVRADYWTSDHRASSTIGLTFDQQQSNALYGDRFEVLDEPLIKTQADSEALALATFIARSLPINRPVLEASGYAASWQPGQYVRAVGSQAGDVLPAPLPMIEVSGRAEGGMLSTTITFGSEPDSSQRLLQRLIRGVRSEDTRQTVVTPASAFSQVGGVVLPVAIADGGTGATTAAAARTNLGLIVGQNLLPAGVTNGHTIRFNTGTGLWEAYSNMLNTTTGVRILASGLALADTALTVEGQTNQTGYVARFRAGSGQQQIAVFENSSSSSVLKITRASIDFTRDVGGTSYINFTPPTFNGIAPNYLTGSSTMVRMGFHVDVFGNTYIGGNFSVANAYAGFQGNPAFPATDLYGHTAPTAPILRARGWNGASYSDWFTVGTTGRVRAHVGYDSSDGTQGLTSTTFPWLTTKSGLVVAVDATLFNEAIDDRVAALLVAGAGVTLTYDDALGTLTISSSASFANQSANTVFAGPTSGGAAAPAFRALVDADVPAAIVRNSRTISTGGGMQGGGDLSANRTLTAANRIVSGVEFFGGAVHLYEINSLGTHALTWPTAVNAEKMAIIFLDNRDIGTATFSVPGGVTYSGSTTVAAGSWAMLWAINSGVSSPTWTVYRLSGT